MLQRQRYYSTCASQQYSISAVYWHESRGSLLGFEPVAEDCLRHDRLAAVTKLDMRFVVCGLWYRKILVVQLNELGIRIMNMKLYSPSSVS